MNIINKIVGKDISSIIYKYLTISKDEVKNEFLKTFRYFDNFLDLIGGYDFRPSILNNDNKLFIEGWEWNNDLKIWKFV
jgi:hypothetical protein